MRQLESNIVRSFRLAKKDINEMKNKVTILSQKYEESFHMLNNLMSRGRNNPPQKKNNSTPITRVVRVVSPKVQSNSRPKTFVAAKEGKKFHIKECPFAQNIKPKSLITFKTKKTALNNGYKPCKCIK